ncbi:MAG TPA: zinc ribbon domain-containing protein [Verrucomicrobiales bacterium]|nr:zinc ribbon domain-containing protein [Verrucomicrobiales bacterium]HIL71686.1 zinc ribbon domain-containing protein [Verrucomicrobiota bacterium]
MPIYEFNCNDCHRESEVLVASTRWQGTQCPHCGSTEIQKKLSVFATHGGDGGSSDFEMPPCTGQPGSCGRCAVD